ncbi:MAG: hypothetical protein GX923_07270 [Clostridia bacterium]|nr:hypothetical protein [Clostridia bacterium]
METTDLKDFQKRLADKVGQVLVKHREEVTDFLDPFLLNVAFKYLVKIPDIKFASFGGSKDTERRRIVICPEYLEPEFNMAKITILELTGNIDYIKINHGDCLGSLLGQGLKREKVGDIYPTERGFIAILSNEVAQFILVHPPQLKGLSLTPQILEADNWQPPFKPGKTIKTSVASLRLDALVASGFGLSRTKVIGDIKGGKVKVNWQEINNISFQCKEKDVISFRGQGRVVIAQIGGETRKGRIAVELLRFK